MIVVDEKDRVVPSASLDGQDESTEPSTVSSVETGTTSGKGSPPPYQARNHPEMSREPSSTSIPSSPVAPTDVTELTPHNYLEVSKSDKPIRGTWLIDTSVRVPPSMLPPWKEKKGVRPNLNIFTHDGKIDAHVHLAGGPADERAVIRTKTHDARIQVHLMSPQGQKVDIRCKTRDAPIHVFLPRSFRGPLNIKAKDGRIEYSEGVKPYVTAVVERKYEKYSFLGRLSSDTDGFNFDESEKEQWRGDQVTVETKDGRVMILYNDEELPESASSGNNILDRILKRS